MSVQPVPSNPADSSLSDLRNTLSPAQRKIVRVCVETYERELIDCLPELESGCRTSAASGSFTHTVQIAKAKKGRFRAQLKSRVRTPRESIDLDMHLDDGQLALGFPPGWTEGDGGEGGSE